MSDYYILDGHKTRAVDAKTWATWWKKNDRHVGNDTINGSRISTVFLGLDHSFGDGPPMLFETLVFDGPLDGEMERYETWKQAEIGHRTMVNRVKNNAMEAAR
jgi:hypothetical protein